MERPPPFRFARGACRMGAMTSPVSASDGLGLPFVATSIDFETTGSVPGFRSEPWQIGLFAAGPGAFSRESISGSWLRIAVDRPFNRYAPGRHAQLRDVLAESPPLRDLLPDLLPLLAGRPLVAHNAGTERAMLADAFPMHRFGPWIDTLKLARRAWPGMASYALEDLVPALGLEAAVSGLCPEGWEPHDARYDAVAAAVLLRHLLSQPGWTGLGPDELAL